jgi:hypothetical protein
MKGKDNLTVPETCRSEAAIDEGGRSQCDGSAREREDDGIQTRIKEEDLMVSSPPSFRT